MELTAPYLPYKSLREVAKRFLLEHHADGGIPVPIEDIVDLGFGIDIFPMPGLKECFDVDAFITNDLKEITVDKTIYEKFPNRYRFSLAHELSHLLIHADIFATLKFKSISEWKSMIQSVPEDQYGWIEWQAYSLAGLILVPEAPLADIFLDYREKAAKAGVDLSELGVKELKPVFSSIARKFEVSIEVIEKRLRLDKFIPSRPT